MSINIKNSLVEYMVNEDKKKYHTDLHSAIDEKYKSNKIVQNKNCLQMTPGAMFKQEAEDKWQNVRLNFAKKNKSAIDKLSKKLKLIESEMQLSEEARNKSSDAERDNYLNQRDAWKIPAKKLGIHKYLTGNGQISNSKLRTALMKIKSESARKDELNKINDLYKQYGALANKLLKQAYQTEKSISDKDSMLIDKYNKLVPQINIVRKEMQLLSANLYDFNNCEIRNPIKELA